MKQTRRFEDVKVGEELPPLDVPTTTALVVGGALASRDFTPVHHDKAAAQAQGPSKQAAQQEATDAQQLDLFFHVRGGDPVAIRAERSGDAGWTSVEIGRASCRERVSYHV